MDVVNDAVRRNLAEDAEDLAAFAARATEPIVDFARVILVVKIGHRREVYR